MIYTVELDNPPGYTIEQIIERIKTVLTYEFSHEANLQVTLQMAQAQQTVTEQLSFTIERAKPDEQR